MNPPQQDQDNAPATPCVTVIIPVYKAEAYVAGGMECLLNQTLRGMEYIFVDDCGGDGSADMIRRYAGQDPRIVLLCNECNHGPGYSRNRGIEAAHGKYIAFFDIDDSCDPDFFETLYNLAEKNNALICKGGREVVYEDGRRERSHLNGNIRKLVAEGYGLYTAFDYEHTTALYRREWVMQTGARNGAYPQGEDTFFLLQVCQGAESAFVCTDAVLYYYQRQAGSLRSTHDRKFLLNQAAHCQEKLDYLNSAGCSGASYYKYCAGLLDVLAHGFMPDVLACGGDAGFYNEYMDKLGRFVSGIKEPEGMRPYVSCAGGVAALRMLADGREPMPWGKRYIASLLQAAPAVAAARLPRGNGFSAKIKRVLINGFLSIIGLDRQDRVRFWSGMVER